MSPIRLYAEAQIPVQEPHQERDLSGVYKAEYELLELGLVVPEEPRE